MSGRCSSRSDGFGFGARSAHDLPMSVQKPLVLGLAAVCALFLLQACQGHATSATGSDGGVSSRPDANAAEMDSGSSTHRDGSAPAADSGGTPGADSGGTPGVDSGGTPSVDSGTLPGTDAGPPPPVGSDPRTSANIYWVGHSLISHRDGSARTIFEMVGDFAESQGHTYDFYRHTTPGAPLSWNWNEEPAKRAEIETRGSGYDVMVMTEGISLVETIRWHYSAFYAKRFYCAMMNANAGAEVYLYESWHHLYASDEEQNYPEPHVFDFRARLDEDRPRWESIIDDVMDGTTTPPDGAYYMGSAGTCTPTTQMRIIPVGTALAALLDRIEHPVSGDDWEGFTRHHFVANGYSDWPAEWPVSAAEAPSVDWRSRIASLTAMHAATPDDIHPSARGAYFVALVHYATVYRRSPIGLPALNGVSAGLARQMQALVWDVVRRDPRTGVVE